jgi:hypothetical protein
VYKEWRTLDTVSKFGSSRKYNIMAKINEDKTYIIRKGLFCGFKRIYEYRGTNTKYKVKKSTSC